MGLVKQDYGSKIYRTTALQKEEKLESNPVTSHPISAFYYKVEPLF